MSAQSANLDTMAELQGNHDSTMGQLLTPYILAALDRAKLVTENLDRPTRKNPPRHLSSAPDQFEEAQVYFEDWLAAEAPASSGVDTFYQQVTAEERRHSVATTLFNVWYRRMLERTFNDERLEWLWTGVDTRRLGRVLPRMLANRGAEPTDQRADYVVARGESIFFDDIQTEQTESSDELILTTLASVLRNSVNDKMEPVKAALVPMTCRLGFGVCDIRFFSGHF